MAADKSPNLDSRVIQEAQEEDPNEIQQAERGNLRLAETFSYMVADLYHAAAEGRVEAFSGNRGELYDLLTPCGNTILHIHITARTKRGWRIQRSKGPIGSTEFVQQMLSWSQGLLDKSNSRLETPLHLAARYGHVDIVELLVNHARARPAGFPESGQGGAAEMLMRTTKEGNTALHEALTDGHLGVVQKLTEYLECPALSSLLNGSGESPLYLAAERGYREIVSRILEKCSSPAYDGPNGRTALHAAVILGDEEMARKILERKGTLTKAVDQIQGWTPLHHASHFGCLQMVTLLLGLDKSAAYIRDSDEKKTALHIAAQGGHTQVMDEIITCCPDSCELVDGKGRNILHFAAWGYRRKVVRLIVKNSSLSYLINQKDGDGNTPLHLLAARGFVCTSLINHPLVDKQAADSKNLTAVDVVRASEAKATLKSRKNQTWKNMKKVGYKRGYRNKLLIEHPEEILERLDMPELKRAKDAHLVAATLIATVTFAAGFTLPGGYSDDNGPDQGTALLSASAAFKAFVVADNIALALSTCAVFILLLLAMHGNNRKIFNLLVWAFILTALAMGSMIVAFTTGLYVVLPHTGLATLSCSITGCLLLFFFFVWRRAVPFELFRGKVDQKAN